MSCKTDRSGWHAARWFWRASRGLLPASGLLLCLLLCFPLQAQIGQSYFAADPANVYDWRAEMINPSIGAFQGAALEAGFKVFHSGFVENNSTAFTASYLLLNLPNRLPQQLVAGLQTRFFNTPLFQEGEIRLLLSRRYRQRLALGLSAGMRNIGYNRERFNLDDPDDPVFADGTSRWQPDISAGLTFMPNRRVALALSISHLNRPAATLIGDELRLERRYDMGLSFNIGRVGMVSGGSVEERSTSHGFVQLENPDIGMLQLGFQSLEAWMKGRLRVLGPLSLGYGFSYPLQGLNGLTGGHHETFFVYEFDHIRLVPEMGVYDSSQPLIPDMSRIEVVAQYHVDASSSSFDIFEKKLVREFDATLSPEQLQQLSSFDVGELDSARAETFLPFDMQSVEPADSSHSLNGAEYSSGYRKALGNLKGDLASRPPDVVLITPRTQMKRAVGLGNFLSDNSDAAPAVQLKRSRYLSAADSLRFNHSIAADSLNKNAELLIIRPRELSFTVVPVLAEYLSGQWELVVEDRDGKAVFRSPGTAAAETRVVWDWRDPQGRIIDPGLYRYYVRWIDGSGQPRRSAAQIIRARKLSRSIRLQITRDYRKGEGNIDKVGIILKD